MIISLTEQAAKNLIQDVTKISVIKAFADNCPACVKYAPVFEDVSTALPELVFGQIKVARGQPSDFVSAYMQMGDDNVTIGTPMTFVFKEGALAYRYFGNISFTELLSFISTGKIVSEAAEVQNARIAELDAAVGASMREMNEKIEELQMKHNLLVSETNAEIARIRSAQ